MIDSFRKVLLNRKTELIVFTVCVLLNSSFLLTAKYIHSLDGPQHLYNSTVIYELVKGNAALSEYFSINSVPVGYWTGPFLLSTLNSFLPANVAAKILIFICIAGMAFAFRYAVYSIRNETTYLTLLVIPFSLHTFLAMGYYTFSVSLIFFFLCIGFFIRNYQLLNWKNLLLLGLLFLITYFSHMLVFSFTIAIIALFIVFHAFREKIQKKENALKKHMLISVKTMIALLPAMIMGIIYTLHVFALNTPIPNPVITRFELFNNMFIMKNLVSYDLLKEAVLGKILFITLCAATCYLLIVVIINSLRKQKLCPVTKNKSYNSLFLFLIAGLLFIMYVFMPNVVGTGAVTTRILVLFYLIVIMVLAVQKFHPAIVVLIVGVMLYTGLERRTIAVKNLQTLSSDVSEIMELNEYIEPNTTYFSINYSTYWQHIHLNCYLGVEKPLVNLTNPQCLGHFPVVINENIPCTYLGNHNSQETGLFWFSSGIDKPIEIIDYFVVWGHHKYVYETGRMKQTIDNYYKLVKISSNGNAALYKFNLDALVDESLQKMRNTPDWYAQLQTKARDKNIPIENAMLLDVFYLIDYYNAQSNEMN